MKTRIIALSLCLILVISGLSGCKNNKATEDDVTTQSNSGELGYTKNKIAVQGSGGSIDEIYSSEDITEKVLSEDEIKENIVEKAKLCTLPAEIECILKIKNNYIYTQNSSYKSGLVSSTGDVLLACEYDTIDEFDPEHNVARVVKDDMIGYINLSGEIVIPLIFDSRASTARIGDKFSDGFIAVSQIVEIDGLRFKKWGYMDVEGNLVIPYEYDYAEEFGEGLAAVEKYNYRSYDGKVIDTIAGVINKANEIVIPFGTYDEYSGKFEEGQIRVFKKDLECYVDTQGNPVTEWKKYSTPMWDTTELIYESKTMKIFTSRKDSRISCRIRDTDNNIIHEFLCYRVLYADEGMIVYDDRGGDNDHENLKIYNTETGRIILSYKYEGNNLNYRGTEDAWKFNSGYSDGYIVYSSYNSEIRKLKSVGYIDTQGNFLLGGVYSYYDKFKFGYAIVGYDESLVGSYSILYGMIDTSFQKIVPCLYESIQYDGGNIVTMKRNGLWNVYDFNKIVSEQYVQ